MSNGYRDGAFAVGLIIGVASTLIIVVYGEALYQLIKCISGSEDYCRYAPHEGQREPEWWYWARWFFKAEDTVAQWFMAIFTVVATVILLFTLNAANQTNRAAIGAAQAAQDANELIRNEQRPWLKVSLAPMSGFKIIEGDLRAIVDLKAENIGKSPAVDVQFHWQAYRSNGFAPRQVVHNFLIGWARSPAFNIGTRVIFPGESDGLGGDLTFETITEHDDGSYYLVFGVTYRMDGADWFGHTIELHQIMSASEETFELELMTDGRLVR